MDVAGFHLTYCSNIHPGESWPEVQAALSGALPQVRAQLGLQGPMAIGLRLSSHAAAALEHPATLAAFRRFLADGNYYVFTINGFPYGAFHGERVKERVYLPDWRDHARVQYSDRLARILSAVDGRRTPDLSISTVPGAFRPAATTAADADAIAAGMLEHAVTLRAIREQTGQTIVLAIEPEPACFIETIDEAVTFFTERLFNAERVRRASRDAGKPLDVDDVRRHVGLCLDTCHMAVEFEDPASAFDRLREAGIRIGKVQVTAALQTGSDAGRAALARFADDTYLHQVVERRPGGLVRHNDLPEAIASSPNAPADEWRVHFHVPLFRRGLGALETTQPYVAEVLALLKQNRACKYLEVETYTWDVLPAEYRTGDTCTAIARELEWVRRQLEG